MIKNCIRKMILKTIYVMHVNKFLAVSKMNTILIIFFLVYILNNILKYKKRYMCIISQIYFSQFLFSTQKLLKVTSVKALL